MIGEMPSRRTRIRVAKFTPGTERELICRSAEAFSCHGHWLGKRTFICAGEDCPACMQGVGAKWIGLVAVDLIHPKTRQQELCTLEMTDNGFRALELQAEAAGLKDLLHVWVTVSRRSQRAMLRVGPSPADFAVPELRSPVSNEKLTDAAATLFGLPNLAPGESVEKWAPRAAEAARGMIGRALSLMQD